METIVSNGRGRQVLPSSSRYAAQSARFSILVRSVTRISIPCASTSHTPRETVPFSVRVLPSRKPTMQWCAGLPLRSGRER